MLPEPKWPDQRRWVTSVARVDPDEVLIRGYPLTQIIRSLTYTDAFYLVVRGELPSPGQSRLLDALLCGVLDYALYKPGTVAARIAVSANPSVTAGLAAAILSSGQHTLDPRDAGEFIVGAREAYAESGAKLDEFAASLITDFGKSKRRVPGFGHPVFPYVDPRAQALREVAEAEGLLGPHVAVYEAIHTAFTRQPGKETIPINDVGMTAALLAELGFTPDEMTGITLASTFPGLIAHLSEEMAQGVRIRVVDESLQRYVGPDRRDIPKPGGGMEETS